MLVSVAPALAQERGHTTVLLGAWGCGVFKNPPETAADAFATWLESERFRGVFQRVVFAVYDRSKHQSNRRGFEQLLK